MNKLLVVLALVAAVASPAAGAAAATSQRQSTHPQHPYSARGQAVPVDRVPVYQSPSYEPTNEYLYDHAKGSPG